MKAAKCVILRKPKKVLSETMNPNKSVYSRITKKRGYNEFLGEYMGKTSKL
jgi:hypothetical protein